MSPDTHDSRRDRLEELRADRALFGLDDDERRELEALQEALGAGEDDGHEAAAALLALGLDAQLPRQEMPAGLRDRVASEAAAFFVAAGTPGVARLDDHRPRRPARVDAWGWWAAAACLALAVWAWWAPRDAGDGSLAPAARRERLLASGTAAPSSVAWTATEDPAASGVSGDVVWSDARQEGYMTFRGLPANDPAEAQYQLWIFDGARDERYPVDGGVFDIPAGAEEVVVPIRARLDVDEAVLFAVTIERPGGVVVSDRERLVVLAQVDG